MQSALQECLVAEIALHGEHLAERIGDRSTRSQYKRPTWILRLNKAGFDEQIPGALRTVGIDALQSRHVRRKGEFSKLLRFIDDDLVDADLGDGEEIVLAGGECFKPFLQALLQAFQPLARDAVVAFDLHEQGFVEFQLVMDHLLLECRGHGNETESRMPDDDGVPGRRCRPRQEAMAFVLCKIGFVSDKNASGRV